jgi:hypothetical protein
MKEAKHHLECAENYLERAEIDCLEKAAVMAQLAQAHTDLARAITEMDVASTRRQQQMDGKSNMAFLTDMLAKAMPSDETGLL